MKFWRDEKALCHQQAIVVSSVAVISNVSILIIPFRFAHVTLENKPDVLWKDMIWIHGGPTSNCCINIY